MVLSTADICPFGWKARDFALKGVDDKTYSLANIRGPKGTLVAFIPGQNAEPAAVVKLDAPITVDEVTGELLVLELRYTGATWRETETVHVELCSFIPEPKAWQHREKGKWVESHATYHRA